LVEKRADGAEGREYAGRRLKRSAGTAAGDVKIAEEDEGVIGK
jgi:hypothetical protein